MFKLKEELKGHTSDVKALTQSPSGLVSVSRDSTGRIWNKDPPTVLVGHQGYVNSIASSQGNLLVTGGNDKDILVWSDGNIVSRLRGHTSNVCALDSREGLVVSGSWDKTARIWKKSQKSQKSQECLRVLEGHTQAVWSVCLLSNHTVLTGSADKTICQWDIESGQLLKTFGGHTDAVRALVELADGQFASASNDGTIRIWSIDGACLKTLAGHHAYIYGLDAMSDGTLVSCGEDRTVRLWRNGELEQTIWVPTTSVWAVVAMAGDDDVVACGGSDGIIRVFTKDPEGMADESELRAFAQQNAEFVMSAKTLSQMEPAPASSLEQPGEPNQLLLVKQPDGLSLYQYEAEWIQVGKVTESESEKKEYQGKQYDYLFDVDIQEGRPPLKLPYNTGENAFVAAKRFLEQNDLSMEHLDTVAGFITRNTSGEVKSTEEFADPYTGASRYVPTEEKREYRPPSEYLVNRQGNVEAILKKLREFGGETERLKKLLEGGGGGSSKEEWQGALELIEKTSREWEVARRFPVLDLLRLLVSQDMVDNLEGGNFVDYVAQCSGCLSLAAGSPKPMEINCMMGIRALVNMFWVDPQVIWKSRKQIIDALHGVWSTTANNNLRTTLATLYFNLSLACTRLGTDDDGLEILSHASQFLHADGNNAETQLRLLSVFGILAHRYPLCKDSGRVLGDEVIVILGYQGGSDQVKKMAQEVGEFLKTTAL